MKACGGSSNANRVATLEEGMTFTRISMPNNGAQLFETRIFRAEEICRIYRAPPHMIADLEHAAFKLVAEGLYPGLSNRKTESAPVAARLPLLLRQRCVTAYSPAVQFSEKRRIPPQILDELSRHHRESAARIVISSDREPPSISYRVRMATRWLLTGPTVSARSRERSSRCTRGE